MVVIGGEAVFYERGIPVHVSTCYELQTRIRLGTGGEVSQDGAVGSIPAYPQEVGGARVTPRTHPT